MHWLLFIHKILFSSTYFEMHWLLFIHKILFSSTCFEPQVLIFGRIQLYTCSTWYCHSLWEFVVACRYTPWLYSHKVTGRRNSVSGWRAQSIFSTFICLLFFFLWFCGQTRVMASSFTRFLDHTQRRTTLGRTPLEEWSARRRGLHLTTHNTHNRQTTIPSAVFEPPISTGQRPQTYALE